MTRSPFHPALARNPSAQPLVRTRAAAQGFRFWLVLGVAACLLFPQARASDPLLGWHPLWLVLLPLLSWLITDRTAARGLWRRAVARQRKRSPNQARSLRRN